MSLWTPLTLANVNHAEKVNHRKKAKKLHPKQSSSIKEVKQKTLTNPILPQQTKTEEKDLLSPREKSKDNPRSQEKQSYIVSGALSMVT